MENTKLMKSASIIDRILKVLQGFALAGVIVPAIFIPLTAIFGEKVIASSSRLDLGAVDLNLAGNTLAYMDLPHIKVSIIVMLLGGIVGAAAIWYCLRVLRQILSPMKDGTPFASGIVAQVRKLGWTVLIGGAVAEIGRAVAHLFEIRAYHLEQLLDPNAVSSISYNYSVSLWFVVTALILFFLSYVFRYGEELQREADETL